MQQIYEVMIFTGLVSQKSNGRWQFHGNMEEKTEEEETKSEQRAYKYHCSQGHLRIKKQPLGRPLPNCPACEKAGEAVPFKYVGRYTIPLDQLKKSKFK